MTAAMARSPFPGSETERASVFAITSHGNVPATTSLPSVLVSAANPASWPVDATGRYTWIPDNIVAVSAKAPMAFARNFEPNFSVKWLEKDMALMLESAAEHNVPAPVTALSRQMLRAAIAEGYGDEDIVGSIRVLEKQAGCEVVSPAPKEGASSSR